MLNVRFHLFTIICQQYEFFLNDVIIIIEKIYCFHIRDWFNYAWWSEFDSRICLNGYDYFIILFIKKRIWFMSRFRKYLIILMYWCNFLKNNMRISRYSCFWYWEKIDDISNKKEYWRKSLFFVLFFFLYKLSLLKLCMRDTMIFSPKK